MVAGFVGLMLAVGWWKGRDEDSTEDFFLGGRSVPAWAACLSFVATEFSALTIIGVPATAFRENWNYLQFFLGNAASRIAIAFLFIPAFFKFQCTTIYEYLGQRFGPYTHRTASLFFFVTRLAGSGVRLFAAAMAVKTLVGTSLAATLIFFTIVGIFYIGFGGIKAVVWTNVVQSFAFLAGGLATLWFLHRAVPGGLAAAFGSASAAGRLQVINWGTPATFFTDPNVVLIAVLNGFFGSMAAFGTDHDLMQRLLTVKTRGESQKTLVATIAGSFCVALTYLAVGAALFGYYQLTGAKPAEDLKNVFPVFINTVMPAGLRGLMLAAILLASIDSPLGSLSASFVTDIYRPLIAPGRDDRHYLRVGRLAVVAFGLVLGGLAWICQYAQDLLWLAYQIGGVTFGSLLGVFLLGLLTDVRGDRGNAIAMVVSAVAMAVMLVAIKVGWLPLGWSWLMLIGTTSTIVLSWAMSDRS